jgi:hypothetical protein
MVSASNKPGQEAALPASGRSGSPFFLLPGNTRAGGGLERRAGLMKISGCNLRWRGTAREFTRSLLVMPQPPHSPSEGRPPSAGRSPGGLAVMYAKPICAARRPGSPMYLAYTSGRPLLCPGCDPAATVLRARAPAFWPFALGSARDVADLIRLGEPDNQMPDASRPRGM